MRLFIAICLSDNMRDALVRVEKSLKDSGVTGRFIPGTNLHLTLAFLGERESSDDIEEVMEEVIFQPFWMQLEGSGCFKGLLWAGLRDNSLLRDYVRRLRNELKASDINFDKKPFRPHITIVRQVGGLRGEEVIVPAEGMKVSRISLMKSERIKGQMRYTEIYSVEAQ